MSDAVHACGAKRFGGWTQDGLIPFNVLHAEMNAAWDKNGSGAKF